MLLLTSETPLVRPFAAAKTCVVFHSLEEVVRLESLTGKYAVRTQEKFEIYRVLLSVNWSSEEINHNAPNAFYESLIHRAK